MSWPQWQATGTPVLNPANNVAGPAPPNPNLQYTPEQWQQLQQQNWQQWAQWQQQFELWQQQYGAEYQKSINALAVQSGGILQPTASVQPTQSVLQAATPAIPPLAHPTFQSAATFPTVPVNTSIPPPPSDATKPPLPPGEPPQTLGFNKNVPYNRQPYAAPNYPNQNQTFVNQHNKTFPNQSQNRTNYPPVPNNNQWQQHSNNFAQPPPDYSNKRPAEVPNFGDQKRHKFDAALTNWNAAPNQPQKQPPQWPAKSVPVKLNPEELSEAEKKFDRQFKEWEAQFTRWKEQNANHPDKQQYREYEKKWETWRAQLLERREQMRRKRLGLVAAEKTGVNNNTPVGKPPVCGDNNPSQAALFNRPPHDKPMHFGSGAASAESGSNFLNQSNTSEGIPGLDLVKSGGDGGNPPEDAKSLQKMDLIKSQNLEAISKGIDNILGDSKLMNLLSLVSQNKNFPQTPTAKDVTPEKREPVSRHGSNDSFNKSLGEDNINNVEDHSRSSFGGDSDRFDNRQVGSRENTRLSGGSADRFRDTGRFDNTKTQSDLDSRLVKQFGENFERLEGNRRPNYSERDVRDIGGNVRPLEFEQNARGSINLERPENIRYGNRPGFGNRSLPPNDLNNEHHRRHEFPQGPNNVPHVHPQNRLRKTDESERFSQWDNSNRNPIGKPQEFLPKTDDVKRFDSNNRFAKPTQPPPNNEFEYGESYEDLNEDPFADSSEMDQNQYGRARPLASNVRKQPFSREIGNRRPFREIEPAPSRFEPSPKWSRKDPSVSPNKNRRVNEAPPRPVLLRPEESEEDLWKPDQVIDYCHKSLKSTEPEVLIEPRRFFDYRHKPLNRIPFPQRPKWLSDCVKDVPQFCPLIPRTFESRRYPSSDHFEARDPYRKYDRLDPAYADRGDFESPYKGFEERRRYEDRLRYEDRKYDERPIFSERERRISENRPRFDEDRPAANERTQGEYSRRRAQSFDAADSPTEITDEKHEELFKIKDFDSGSKKIERTKASPNKVNATLIEDLLMPPGRYKRPPRIVIILRGPPGSGKTFLAKLIKDKEVENGGSAPRILSLDDYFMVEQEKETEEDGKKIKVKEMVYEFEESMEETYRTSLMKSFKKTVTDGYFSFIIVDNINDKVKYFGEMWSFAKNNGFQVFVCQLELDVYTCSKRNIHGRSESDIRKCVDGWESTPVHHSILDATSLIQSGSIPEVEMEEICSPPGDEAEDEREFPQEQVFRSKWDSLDYSIDNLAKLDGTSKPLRPSGTMEDYLQLDDEWVQTTPSKPGQKRVRWADLEERRQQEKMRAIGFVVGQTDWNRMMDPTMGSGALTETKYIENCRRYY